MAIKNSGTGSAPVVSEVYSRVIYFLLLYVKTQLVAQLENTSMN